MEAAKFEVAAVLLNIPISWDCFILKMKALQSFRTLGTTGPMTQHHISEDLHFQHRSCLKCMFNFVFDSGNKLTIVKFCMTVDHKHCYKFWMNHFLC
jgi:hypothetical protein